VILSKRSHGGHRARIWRGPTIGGIPPRRGLALTAVVLAALLGTAAGVITSGSRHGHAPRPVRGPGARASLSAQSPGAELTSPPTGSQRPNIVFVLTDDLSMNLLPYMPQVRALQAQGMTFRNYFVSDSLCCPSRSSIFTGNFPHDTGVFTNTGPGGGIRAFFAHDNEQRTFNLALQRAGYRTAMMGKYLNGYLQGPGQSPVPSTYVPPGWSQWDVAGWGYREFGYRLNEDGVIHRFGDLPRDYLTNVIARRGVRFIDRSAQAGQPFFLELATFSPHTPYVPAPRDRRDFPGLTAPRPPSFDVLPTHAPQWLARHPPLTARQLAHIDRAFRRRAQAVQSVDRLIAAVRGALAAHGLERNTYVVFSSDNGLHTGEYRLTPGKLTAFDTDIHVPLVITGPRVPAGRSTDAMTANVDLATTFATIGGTTLPSDGHSLMPLLRGAAPTGWRNAVLVEHHGPAIDPGDPDAQDALSGNPTSYEAMRTGRFLYVEYRDGEREFYDLRTDPDELHNTADRLSPAEVSDLHTELARLENCHSGASCWSAGHATGR
jgi:N-acetylglucosamine-6-sulfatase